jgi:iron complex transport system ATP-binding protein
MASTCPAGRPLDRRGRPNGAGKTTLLKALAHLLPAKGTIELLGRPPATWGARERGARAGLAGAGRAGAEDLLAGDVVHARPPAAPGLAGRRRRAPTTPRCARAMRATQCWEWRGRRSANCPAASASACCWRARWRSKRAVLLMDEPLANLDPPHQADWLAWCAATSPRGGTVVSVLHELTLALQADDLLVIADGRVAHHGACADPPRTALRPCSASACRCTMSAGRWVALPG